MPIPDEQAEPKPAEESPEEIRCRRVIEVQNKRIKRMIKSMEELYGQTVSRQRGLPLPGGQ